MDILTETLNNIREATGENIDITVSENYGEIKRETTLDDEIKNLLDNK